MSAGRGWISDPQPAVDWHESHYSRQADRLHDAEHVCALGAVSARQCRLRMDDRGSDPIFPTVETIARGTP
jgi:hypothetical protein